MPTLSAYPGSLNLLLPLHSKIGINLLDNIFCYSVFIVVLHRAFQVKSLGWRLQAEFVDDFGLITHLKFATKAPCRRQNAFAAPKSSDARSMFVRARCQNGRLSFAMYGQVGSTLEDVFARDVDKPRKQQPRRLRSLKSKKRRSGLLVAIRQGGFVEGMTWTKCACAARRFSSTFQYAQNLSGFDKHGGKSPFDTNRLDCGFELCLTLNCESSV